MKLPMDGKEKMVTGLAVAVFISYSRTSGLEEAPTS
jgi:hypothetical protein